MKQKCWNCFKPTGADGICPSCGYDNASADNGGAVKAGTLLASRYLVGRLKSSDGEMNVYNGYDTDKEAKRRLLEFCPERHCQRLEDGTLAVKPGHEDAYKRALGLAVEELEESEDKKYTAFTAGGTTWFVERKKAAPKAAPEPEEELVENPFSGKLPAIIVAGVIIIGLIYLAVRLLGGGPKDDPTTQDVTPTPTAVSQNISWLPDVSPTPTPYVWSEPTQNTSIKYADWMAQPGDTSSTKPTATPFTPTPTPYNMWDELQHEIDSTWGSMTPTP
ncbi:MAG: hypothetical protein IKY06_00315, partial [Clostridia bacterium]|nr:hypothetical protein [Clostridia bacterium]